MVTGIKDKRLFLYHNSHAKSSGLNKTIYIHSLSSKMKVVRYFEYFLLGLMLFLSSFGSFKSFGTDTPSGNIDDRRLAELLAEYQNWNVNVPTEQLPEEGNQCLIKTDSIIFLLDPFSKGTVTQACRVNSGNSLLFPFYHGWCDSGGDDLYGGHILYPKI